MQSPLHYIQIEILYFQSHFFIYCLYFKFFSASSTESYPYNFAVLFNISYV